MTAALVGSVAAASLAGSLHCAGMCGGFAALFAGGAGRGRARAAVHAAYHAGRLVTYAALGALSGALGVAVDLAGRLAGLRGAAAIVSGLLIVAWGAWALAQALGARWRLPWRGGALARAVARGTAALAGRPPLVRALGLGLVTVLLPCGWLWAFVLLAAGAGGPAAGALLMAVFWAGSVPALLGFGALLDLLAAPVRRRLPALTAAMMIAVGLLWLAGRTTLPVPSPERPSSPAAASCPQHDDPR